MPTTVSTLTASIDGGAEVPAELDIETEQIDVTTTGKTVPDMAWEHVDQRGHYHAWTDGGELPTLDVRSEHEECTGSHDLDPDDPLFIDCEGYDVTVHSCKICGEIVEPGTKFIPSFGREYTPGRTTWTVRVGAHLEHGQSVSVLLRTGASSAFGIGQVVKVDEGTSTIVGAGELGHRGGLRSSS